MTVCIVIAAMRFGLMLGRSFPAAAASSINSVSRASSGACAIFTSDGCDTSRRGAKSVNSGRLRRRIGPRRLEKQLNRHLQPFHRVPVGAGRGADLVGGPAQRILEQGEQKLVLTVELKVEAAQRLTGAIDDFLNGEVGGALFDDDRLGGVEESLDPLRGPELRCLDRAFDRALLPCGFFARACHRRLGCLPIGENMD